MSPKLELRQGHALVMTPQLQQAIKLLQMSNFELQSYVEAELERNPLLESDVETDEAKSSTISKSDGLDVPSGGDDAAFTNAADSPQPSDSTFAEEAHNADAPVGLMDSGWNNLRSSAGGSFQPHDDFDLDAVTTRERTLHEHLTEQLHLAIHNQADRIIAVNLLGMIDEAGYLTGDIKTLADTLGAKLVDVERVLAQLQDFDPAGVFARDLKECLALQLKERKRFDPAMEKLVANLDLLARRDIGALQKICEVDRDDLKDMIQEVKALNPKPGNAFGSVVVQPVVPDVVVRAAPDSSWIVELNSETMPRVLVNEQYYAKVTRGTGREQDKVYLNECLSTAVWLIKSLDQRARTILKVAREIVRQQDGFLMEGVQALRPLNLKTVADSIGMHESTVSRVTSNKYMATPRGTFELKYFFTTALGATEGEDTHSAEAVRHRIRELIKSEIRDDVLSDDIIVERLKEAGVEIARRTVAKYREAMGIPSSVQRRREKRFHS